MKKKLKKREKRIKKGRAAMSEVNRHLFTSESVGEGHPDKLCDQISDAVLDAFLGQDANARVACEALIGHGFLTVAGEITANAEVDIPKVARAVIKDVGYDDTSRGFDYKNCDIRAQVHRQSPDIAMGVDKGGAGDQGMMFGFATKETPEYMPLPLQLAHRLARRLSEVRKAGLVDYLRPDGKTQVTVEYHDGEAARLDAIVVSAHHKSGVALSKIRSDIKEFVIAPVVPKQWLDKKTTIYVNPTGRFEVGGSMGDTGLTGRKIIMDTYGGVIGHGGGAFSGKDPTKVDRSAAYMARYVAKNLVAAGIAEQCEIELAYAIGVAEPVSIMADTHGTGKLSEAAIIKIIRQTFDLTPLGIIRTLKLRRPIYLRTAAYGHFGRDDDGFTWEELDKVNDIKQAAKHS